MKDILKYVILSGLFGVLLIPFIVINSLVYPEITSKAFIFRILTEILFGLWLILITKDGEYRPKFSWVIGCAGIFTLVILIADMHAIDSYRALWGNFERMEGWVTIVHLFAYLLILCSMFRTERIWLWFFRASVSLSLIMALIGFSELASGGTTRISGTLGNPIYLAIYLLFNLFFTLLLLYKDVLLKSLTGRSFYKETFHNYLLYAYSLIALLSVYLIYLSSRGALLGLLGGLFLTMLLLATFEKKHLLIRKISITGIILIILLVGGFMTIRQTDFVKNNPTLHKLAATSWNNTADPASISRQMIWGMAVQGFKEKPLLGWGQEGFHYVFKKYDNPRLYNLEPSWFDRVHSTPLDFLVAGGILGLLSYLSLFALALYLLWFRGKDLSIIEKSLITGLLAGYFFQGLFVFDNITSYFLFFMVLAYVHFSCRQGPSLSDPEKELSLSTNSDYQNYIFIPAVIILTVSITWWTNIRPISAGIDFESAIQSEKNGKIADSFNYYKQALSVNSFGGAEIREQLLSSLSEDILKSDTLSQDKKREYLQYIYDQAREQIKETPNNARYYFLSGLFLNDTGNSDLALEYLKKAKDLMPNYQPIRFEIITALLFLDRRVEALAEAKSTYELDPNYLEARFLYASTAAYNNQPAIADNLISGLDTPFDKIQNVYAVEAAQAYKVGNKTRAVAEIQKLIKINPLYKSEGEQAIASILAGTIDFSNPKPEKMLLK